MWAFRQSRALPLSGDWWRLVLLLIIVTGSFAFIISRGTIRQDESTFNSSTRR